jgi:hypothetical protein
LITALLTSHKRSQQRIGKKNVKHELLSTTLQNTNSTGSQQQQIIHPKVHLSVQSELDGFAKEQLSNLVNPTEPEK